MVTLQLRAQIAAGLLVCGIFPLAAQDATSASAKAFTAAPLTASAGLLPKQVSVNDFKPEHRAFYRWSLVAVGAGNAADTISSWNQGESNPLLSSSGGTFDARSIAIKAGLLGTTFMIERIALRHNPHFYKQFGWLNFGIAGGLGAAAAHNFSIR